MCSRRSPLRISIDASSLANPRRTGIGRTLECILPPLIDCIGGGARIRLFAGGKFTSRAALGLIQVGSVEAETFQFPSLYAWQQSGMAWAVRRFAPDVHLAPDGLIPPFLHAPAVQIVHDLLWLRHPETCKPQIRWVYRLRFAASLRAARITLCDSAFTRDEIRQAFPDIPGKALRVSGLAADSREFHPPSPGDSSALEEFLRDHRIDRPYLLAVGNVRPHKNLVVIPRALKLVEGGGRPPSLVIVGAADAGSIATLRSLAPRPGSIHALGYLNEEDLIRAYQGAVALIFPSRYEGFGLPVLEAMACGTPVIHSDAGALPEVAGGAGEGFDPDAPEELAALLNRLLGDRAFGAELRRRGLERAMAFTWENTAARLWEALQEAAAGSPSIGADSSKPAGAARPESQETDE